MPAGTRQHTAHIKPTRSLPPGSWQTAPANKKATTKISRPQPEVEKTGTPPLPLQTEHVPVWKHKHPNLLFIRAQNVEDGGRVGPLHPRHQRGLARRLGARQAERAAGQPVVAAASGAIAPGAVIKGTGKGVAAGCRTRRRDKGGGHGCDAPGSRRVAERSGGASRHQGRRRVWWRGRRCWGGGPDEFWVHAVLATQRDGSRRYIYKNMCHKYHHLEVF